MIMSCSFEDANRLEISRAAEAAWGAGRDGKEHSFALRREIAGSPEI